MLVTPDLSGPALAQDAEQERGTDDNTDGREILGELPADVVGDRAAKLLARIHETISNIERYRSRLAAASAEDSLVLRAQLTSRQFQGLADVHELADVLLGLEEQGAQPELRGEVENAYAVITPHIWTYIDRLRAEIDETRARRPGTPVEERSALEDRITKLTGHLDQAYELGLTHLDKLEKLGLDSSEAQAALSQSLLDRADELSGRIELDLDRSEDLKARRKESPDDANAATLLITAQKSLDNNTRSLRATLDLMDALELPTEDYRTQLVEATRDLSAGLMDTSVAVSLAGRALSRITGWFTEQGPQLLVKLLIFLAILFVFRLLARLVRRAVAKSLASSKLNISLLLRDMIQNWASNLVMLFGLLVALSQLGISLGPLLAGLGVAGFILGFALQDSLSNFAAGMMILIYRPYDVGDMVDVSGAFGKVDRMSLVSTTILTVDNQVIVVPNSKIWGDVIKNVTAQDNRRVDMTFGISYTDDIPKAEQVLTEILQEHEKVLDDPEFVVKLHTLGESSVDFVVRPWVKADDYWDVYWDVTRAVKLRFDAEGISIPFPQRDVHVYNEQPIPTEEKS
jgi:small conductance mechanosensitive channel